MNDFDLESRLRSFQAPERSDEYWNDFPSRIRVQLREATPDFERRPLWRPRLAWGLAVAMVIAFVCVEYHPLRTASLALAKKERHIHVQLARLDASLHVLVLNTDGMGYLLKEPD